MNRKRNLTMAAISALLSCLLVYGIYSLQLMHVEAQRMMHVVVPSQFIDAGKLITEDLVEYKAIVAASYDQRMFTNLSDVIGQETGIALGSAEPIMDWKLNKFNLLPNSEQSTFQIPKAYVLSISNGIRAGDRVVIYISSSDDHVASRRLFTEDIIVASVKTTANLEVEDIRDSSVLARVKGDLEQLYASRRNANAAIDQINLNLNEEQWLAIDRLCRSGDTKLVIAFTPASSHLDVQ